MPETDPVDISGYLKTGKNVIGCQILSGNEVELWLDSREKVKLPVIEKTVNGITKYRLTGGSKLILKLKFT